jgi:DNA-binding transcriptional ArsR family regulator
MSGPQGEVEMEGVTRALRECEEQASDDAGGRARPARSGLVDEATAERLAQTFRALGDPTRVRILSVLAEGELCVHQIADCLAMSQSAISHQLSTLRELRLVRFRKLGRHVYYKLDDDHIESLFACGLEHVAHD